MHWLRCVSGGRGSRGTRQLKDFIPDGGERANQPKQQSVDDNQSSDRHGHEADVIDDREINTGDARRPAVGSGGRRGQVRTRGIGRGQCDEIRRQQVKTEIGDRRQRYGNVREISVRESNVRGRGFTSDSHSSQRVGSSSSRPERRDFEYRSATTRGSDESPKGDRQYVEYRSEVQHGQGKAMVGDRRYVAYHSETHGRPDKQREDRQYVEYPRSDVEYHLETHPAPGKQKGDRQQRYDNTQPMTRNVKSEEDWNGEVDTSRASEQHRERYRTWQSPNNRASGPPPASVSDHRVSGIDTQVSSQPARHVHPTRTISNRNYQPATAENIPSRDRSGQIGGIVDAMNKISVRTTATDSRRDVGSQQGLALQSSAIIVSGRLSLSQAGFRYLRYFLLSQVSYHCLR